jgi:hypothetical protein
LLKTQDAHSHPLSNRRSLTPLINATAGGAEYLSVDLEELEEKLPGLMVNVNKG